MLPAAIRVYEVSGPLFFGASDAIEHIIVEKVQNAWYCYEGSTGTGQYSHECP